jgi:hypothetical protein
VKGENMIKVFTAASALPDIWDDIFIGNNYMLKNQLLILEKCNPCHQSYVIINDRSAFVIYKLKLNIFSYAKLNLNMTVYIIGVPCSVSKQGYMLEAKDIDEFENYIKKQKKGCIILNSEDSSLSPFLIKGETLPTCKLNILWNSFEDFVLSLRSHYRYRLKKALLKAKGITIKELEDNNGFDEKLYSLYEQVYEKSQYKLEKLGIDFFKLLPSSIYVFYLLDKPAAFIQLANNNGELSFVFGGIDYDLNHKYDLYMNMLAFILKYGIENKYSTVDMGQTAEDTKMKLGCQQHKKYMHIYHPNFIIRFLIKFFSEKLSYKPVSLQLNLFKEVKGLNDL